MVISEHALEILEFPKILADLAEFVIILITGDLPYKFVLWEKEKKRILLNV